MSEELKRLIEEQGKAHAAFENTAKEARAKNAQSIEELRSEHSAYAEKMDKQLADLDNYKEKVDELSAQAERESVAGQVEAKNAQIVTDFWNIARKGESAFHNTMEVRSDPDGGYTVPQEIAQRIITSSEGNNPMAMLADRQTISGNSLDVQADPDEVGYSNSAEGSAASASTTPEVFLTNIPLRKIDSEPSATIELLQDSAWNIEAYLEGKASRIFRKRANNQWTVGDGSPTKCRGIMTYTAVANATFEAALTTYWGNSIGYVASGNASTLPDADSLIGLTDAVQDVYLDNASFMMKRATLTVVRQLKATVSTAGDKLYTLWSPSLVPGQPDTLMGYPVYKNDAMASIAANALPILFGDIQEAYTIVDKANGMYMVRDPYTDKSKVKFYFARRTGGGVVNFEAVKYLKIASS